MEFSDELFRRLLEAAPDAILIVDQAGAIAHANPQTAHLFGYPTEEMETLAIEALIPERARHRHVAHRESYQANSALRPMGKEGLALLGRHRDGHEFPVAISLSPVEIEGAWYTIAICRDMTEHQKTEETLRQTMNHLRQANRELESFSYSVAHDLRAPLRSIDGFSQALLEDYGDQLDAIAHDYLARVRAAAQRMASLIDDLLALSRVSRAEIIIGEVDLSETAVEIGKRLLSTETKRTIDLVVAPHLVARADPRLVAILLENLLRNAVKFTSKRDEARIVVGRNEAGAFFVKDNGAGFDMAHAHKLFGVFQRLHSSAEFEGTGIGLATVERIVARHGGRVWAEAEVDRGATFFFELASATGGAT